MRNIRLHDEETEETSELNIESLTKEHSDDCATGDLEENFDETDESLAENEVEELVF